MTSFLLQQLTRILLPFALLLGLSLLLKGHDHPGGGFDGGLAWAAAAILAFTAYGARRFHGTLPLEPERIALLGGLVLLASVAVPPLLGAPALTHGSRVVALGPLAWKADSMLWFEVGVAMVVGGGLAAAALWLWETPTRAERER